MARCKLCGFRKRGDGHGEGKHCQQMTRMAGGQKHVRVYVLSNNEIALRNDRREA